MASGKRYLVLAEGKSGDPHYGKTMRGVVRYGADPVVVVLDSERAGESYEGLPIVGTVEEALALRADDGDRRRRHRRRALPAGVEGAAAGCVAAGLDLENGLHEFLTNDPELVALAAEHGVELRDLRKPPAGLNVPTGENLEVPATIVLTVGSDCAIGKMTMALELDREAQRRGIKSVFVPTGQTGIAIAGWGIAIDAVVADFIAGATEQLVVEGRARGGELLWVEGQGSLSHPAYSGVTMGLIHGAAPHLFVLCHQAGTTEIEGFPGHPLLPLPELVALHEAISLPARKAKVAAIALNTRTLDEEAARQAIADAEAETGLVADDPVRFGAGRLLEAVLRRRLTPNTRSLYSRTHVRTGRSRRRSSRTCRRVQRAQLDQRRARADLRRSRRRHGLVDRGVALRRGHRARRSGASRIATTSARSCTRASG